MASRTMRLTPLFVVLTSTIVAAQSVTLPPAATQVAGNRHHSYLFYSASSGPNEARTQLLYPLADIPAGFSVIRQISFRPIGSLANAAASIDLDIEMSTSPRDPDDPSAVFASNAPGPSTRVFTGVVSLPATNTGPWPLPWVVQIPLQSAFTLAPASGDRSLVIDVRCRNGTGARSWWVEQYATVQTVRGHGGQILNHPTCLLPDGQPQMQSSFRPDLLHPGGRVSLTLGLYPNNQPSAAVNALMIGLTAQGGMMGNATLPVELSRLGVPAPPNCMWTVVPLASVAMKYNSYSWGGTLTTDQRFPIPNIPGLAGLRFFAQNTAMLRYPTGMLVFPSVAMEFTIGDSVTPSGGSVSAAGNRNATSGLVSEAGPASILLR